MVSEKTLQKDPVHEKPPNIKGDANARQRLLDILRADLQNTNDLVAQQPNNMDLLQMDEQDFVLPDAIEIFNAIDNAQEADFQPIGLIPTGEDMTIDEQVIDRETCK